MALAGRALSHRATAHMSWEPSDAWRDSYDRWKLATPPEYEREEAPDRCPCCHDGVVDPATNYRNPGSDVCSNCEGTGSVDDGREEPPAEDDERSRTPGSWEPADDGEVDF